MAFIFDDEILEQAEKGDSDAQIEMAKLDRRPALPIATVADALYVIDENIESLRERSNAINELVMLGWEKLSNPALVIYRKLYSLMELREILTAPLVQHPGRKDDPV